MRKTVFECVYVSERRRVWQENWWVCCCLFPFIW